MKKFSILLSMMFTFTLFSCDETEGVIYDGGQTFVSFDSSTAELPIVIDATGEVAIPVLVSSTSNEDRIATIEIDLENSTADPQNYSVPPTVVIPANSYQGTLLVTGIDVTAETTPELLILYISDFSDPTAAISKAKLEVSVLEVCPLFADFTGNYVITAIQSSPFWGEFMPNGTVVNVVATSEYGRRIHNPNFLIGGHAFDMDFVLNCGNVHAVPKTTTIWCGSGNYYAMGQASTPGNYDPNDDSEIIVTYAENTDGACDEPTTIASFKLTKQ